ncbi:MAG TPA: ribonuclease III [Petrotogaceae bacterium]|jgi:ribonuclease-3|nr:ribonuclease III [Petrotogaceae bacterium]HQF32945.1 ribonuclease III [Petrotogaceae bacterium]HQH32045.1 ribonuclease III [Petrotogaceae bacterium]HQI78102.1 ribonuclease III [Petrotogaceae bacterium]
MFNEKKVIENAIKEFNLPQGINEQLIFNSLCHTSYVFEKSNKDRHISSNERLEFLGDAVLELVLSEYLYLEYKLSEGDMSKIRATVASEIVLSEVAKEIGVEKYIFLGSGEEKYGGRMKSSILADTTEALIAAIYLSLGYEYAKSFILKYIDFYVKEAINGVLFLDYKTKLQEITQEKYKVLPEYVLIDSNGPDHTRLYTIEVRINGLSCGTGNGQSKKIAEQLAAKQACQKILAEELKSE